MTELSAAHTEQTPSTGQQIQSLVEIGILFGAFLATRWAGVHLGLPMTGPLAVVASVLAATVMLHASNGSWKAAGLRLPGTGWGWAALPLIVIAIMAATVASVMVLLPQIAGYLNISPSVGGDDAFSFLRGDLLALIGYLGVVAWGTAAFGEEMIFRGFLLGRLETLFGGTTPALTLALIIQAAIFGLAHGYQGLYGIMMTGLIGLVMGIGYLVGRRWLLPLILAHGLIDTISLVQIYAGVDG